MEWQVSFFAVLIHAKLHSNYRPLTNSRFCEVNCSHAAVFTSDLRCVMPLHSFGGVVLEAQSGAQRVTNGLSVIRNYLNIRMLQSILISWIF